MKPVYRVADVRTAEATLMAGLPDGQLMQRAAAGLATAVIGALRERRGKLVGARVVLLVGAGDNGGDALWAGARLAARGVAVTAVLLAERWHLGGAAALRAAGGRIEPVDEDRHCALISGADAVLDGIVGIGGAGALRGSAVPLAAAARRSTAITIAVDLPSGIDADTGAVADPERVVFADLTVTFGVIKPGLVLAPGHLQVGELTLVDIGLQSACAEPPTLQVIEAADVALRLPSPGPTDDKYTRGVVGVVSGSKPYPGAAVLSTGAARLGGTGMVRYAGGAPEQVIAHWPEVVISHDGPAKAGRVQAWVVGPGAGTDHAAANRLAEVLAASVPVLIDADGLTLLADHQRFRDALTDRAASGKATVVTPHAGEFARLGFELGSGAQEDRVASVLRAARELSAVVLLKGAHTVVAEPGGHVFVNTRSASGLATAGSGDVLSGLAGSMLAATNARALADGGELVPEQVAEVIAGAAFVHGFAGQFAGRGGVPITAADVLSAVPVAIAAIRSTGSAADRD